MRFEWDPPKAEANLRSHRVSFAEAVTVLEDDFGFEQPGKLALVVYMYREPDIIRVIPAWRASKRQRALYEEGRG